MTAGLLKIFCIILQNPAPQLSQRLLNHPEAKRIGSCMHPDGSSNLISGNLLHVQPLAAQNLQRDYKELMV